MNSSVKTVPLFRDIESMSMDEIDAEIKCLRQRLNELIQAQSSKLTPGFNATRLTQEILDIAQKRASDTHGNSGYAAAIKTYRERTGCGLMEAKYAVDAILSAAHMRQP
jgi:ribosomal protein L7/L12